jgi:hypothetical protein
MILLTAAGDGQRQLDLVLGDTGSRMTASQHGVLAHRSPLRALSSVG